MKTRGECNKFHMKKLQNCKNRDYVWNVVHETYPVNSTRMAMIGALAFEASATCKRAGGEWGPAKYGLSRMRRSTPGPERLWALRWSAKPSGKRNGALPEIG